MTTAAADARSIVQSFYANLAGGQPEASFALCADDIEWIEAEGNPLADRNPYRGAKLDCQAVRSWWINGGKIVRFQQYANTAQLSRLS